jgi:hypothetical protein
MGSHHGFIPIRLLVTTIIIRRVFANVQPLAGNIRHALLLNNNDGIWTLDSSVLRSLIILGLTKEKNELCDLI